MGNCLAACNKRVEDVGGGVAGEEKLSLGPICSVGTSSGPQKSLIASAAQVSKNRIEQATIKCETILDTPALPVKNGNGFCAEISRSTSKPSTPEVEEAYCIVQKELDDLQTKLSHSQAVLSTLKYKYVGVDGEEKRIILLITRSTQTSPCAVLEQPAIDLRRELCYSQERKNPEEIPNQLDSNAIANVKPDVFTKAVQTDMCQLIMKTRSDIEYFIPPIASISPDIEDELTGDGLGQLIGPDALDLDIHRSCRKLSVLPEEQIYDVSAGWARQHSDPGGGGSGDQDQDGTGLEGGSNGSGITVRRQASDPSPRSASTTRPLQLPSRGDSAISSAGSTTSSPLPPPQPPPMPIACLFDATPIETSPAPMSPSSPLLPPAGSSSDTSLSFFTPDDFPTDPTLSPPSLLSPTPMARVPSRRRLVRSLATDNPSDSDSPQKIALLNQEYETSVSGKLNAKELRTALLGEMEAAAIRRPSSSSSGGGSTGLNQDQGLNTLLDHPSPFGELPSSPEEIESVATSLAIAFKTDKLTLLRRLEIQTRLRDQSEINVANEIQALRHLAQEVCPGGEDGDKAELARRLEEQIETLHRSAKYVSSAAEMYGAVQHEKRLSQAMEVITKHVENLRQALEDERHSHEETRKLLKENKPLISPLKIQQQSPNKRRASIATLDQGHASSDGRLTGRKGSLIKRFSNCKSSSYSEINTGFRKSSDCGLLDRQQGRVEEFVGDEDDGTIDSGMGNSSVECHDQDCHCRHEADIGDDCDETDEFDRPSKSNFSEEVPSIRKNPMRYKFKKRGSFIAPRWFIKLAEEWGWLQGPMQDLMTQIRYAAAGLCVLAAFAILSSSFFLSSDL